MQEGRALYYIATMIPTDEEDHKRIEKHIDDRCGWGFKTLEQGINICDLLKTNIDPQGAFLFRQCDGASVQRNV